MTRLLASDKTMSIYKIQKRMTLIFIWVMAGSCQTNDHDLMNDLSPVNVIVFLGTECPISQQYSLTLENLKKEYAQADSLNFIVLFPEKIRQSEADNFLKTYTMSWQPFVDADLIWAKKFNATVTPEVFIVSKELEILYQGAIDNWYRALGENRQIIDEHYLRGNLQALLSGEELPFANTKAVGCFIEY